MSIVDTLDEVSPSFLLRSLLEKYPFSAHDLPVSVRYFNTENALENHPTLLKRPPLLDKKGNELIPCRYDEVWPFCEGLASVELNDKWGFIDTEGQMVIPCIYDGAGSFHEGYAEVCSNERFGVIDKSGRWVIHPVVYIPWGINW